MHRRTRPSPTLFFTVLPAAALALGGCAGGSSARGGGSVETVACVDPQARQAVEEARLFRRAETDRAEQLSHEIARLQADLEAAESALVEVESGLAGSSSRADAVSSLAVTRIKVERAAARAPWRRDDIETARAKLDLAERQVDAERFGAALFFVYRARRVAEGVLHEADQVMEAGNARLIDAERVNLRAGPSTDRAVLAVLEAGTPILPQTIEGEWVLIQVTGGPAGWIHRSLLGTPLAGEAPAAARP